MKYFFISYLLFLSLAGHSQDTLSLTLLFAGDVMGHDSQIKSAYQAEWNDYDYSSCFAPIQPIISTHDIALANLEVTLAGPPYKGYPQFSSPDALAWDLKTAGFDVLVTANNHSCDGGKRGIERTIGVLDLINLKHTGSFVHDSVRSKTYPLIIDTLGFTLAILNFTYGTNGLPIPKPTIVNLIDTTALKNDIEKAKAYHPDVIISFVHWGNEYELKENSFQRKIADFLHQSGSSIVIGAHPHVIQPMHWDTLSQQITVYSLGNFVSGQRTFPRDGGALFHLKLDKIKNFDTTKTIISDARYSLVWVYFNVSTKKYSVIPLPYENVLPEEAERAKKEFETKMNDHLKTYNTNVLPYEK